MPKFLLLRFSSIGDIVLTTPVIRCLKQQVNGAEVHVATKAGFASVIQHNPFIDKQFFLEDNLDALIRELKKEKYDYIIDLHHNLRTFLIKARLGVKSFLQRRDSPKAVSFNKINFEKWLMVKFKIDRLPPIHIVDRYMETVKSFNVVNDGKGLDYFISPEDEQVVEQLPASHRNGYIGFVIGARHATKRMPVGKIISICKKISQPIVLLGGKEDSERAEEIVRESQISNLTSFGRRRLAEGEAHIFNATGKFTINQSAALVKHASKIITHDTGLMHIAAAFKKEIISVWGNTIPEFGMSPYYGNIEIQDSRFEIRNLSCRPCTKLGYEKCPKGHFKCMMEIDEMKIVESIS